MAIKDLVSLVPFRGVQTLKDQKSFESALKGQTEPVKDFAICRVGRIAT